MADEPYVFAVAMKDSVILVLEGDCLALIAFPGVFDLRSLTSNDGDMR
jgi:hypothetical protein